MSAGRVVCVAGGPHRGSGYVIAGRLVLTSAHVTTEVGKRVQIFPAGCPRVFTARVVWRGTPGGRDDAALVEVDDSEWEPPRGRGPGWGRLVTDRPGIDAYADGFPDWVQRPEQAVDTWQIFGRMNPGSRYVADQYVLTLDGQPPQRQRQDGSPWAGLSGAGLFCGPLLAGVIQADVAAGRHGYLNAVPLYVLYADPQFREVLAAHGGETVLEPVELRAWAEPVSPAGPSAAALLAAHAETVGFHGRAQVLQQLQDWCAGDGFAVRLVHAGGGQGKTRLGVELARRLNARRWASVWLRGDVTVAQLQVLAEVAVPLLVIVDYAETRTEQLTWLLRVCAEHPGGTPVRVLLLARTAGDWWSNLPAADRTVEYLLDGAVAVPLPVLDPDPTVRRDAYRHAVTDLARGLAGLPDHQHDWTAIIARLTAAGRLTGDHQGDAGGPVSALTVQMNALADLLDTATPPESAGQPPVESVEDRVLVHERRWWWTTAGAEHLHPGLFSKDTLTDALTVAMLFGAHDHDSADTLLQHLPALAGQTRDHRNRIVAWIARLYPPPAGTTRLWGSLQPDRLAERATGLHLAAHPDLPDPLLSAAAPTPQQCTQLVTGYTRAAAQPAFDHRLDTSLTGLVLRHAPLLGGPAIDIATQVDNPAPLTAALTRLAGDPATSLDQLITLTHRLPAISRNLAATAAALTRRLVDEHRHRRSPVHQAYWLTWHALRLAEAGRRAEALSASDEAVQLYRELAAGNRDAYLPNLATSVNNHALRLAEAGRRAEALTASDEAVQLRRELAAGNRDAYLPDLATSLWMVGLVYLRVDGPLEGALAAVTEAVDFFTELAAAEPDGFTDRLRAAAATLADVHEAMGDLRSAAEVRARFTAPDT
ncbi:MAG: tetratricopeptide repeat protein [Sciscionella sp.]